MRHCEKAAKFKISHLFWHLLSSVKTSVIYFQILLAFSENQNFRMWYPAVIQLTNDSFGTGPQNYVIFQLRDFFLSTCNPLSMLSFVKLHGALLIFLIIIIIIWYVVVFFPTTYCDRFAQKMCPNKNHSAGTSLNKFLGTNISLCLTVKLAWRKATKMLIFRATKGTSINDIPQFSTTFDLHTYLSPISSYFDKATYLMTSHFDWPTLMSVRSWSFSLDGS